MKITRCVLCNNSIDPYLVREETKVVNMQARNAPWEEMRRELDKVMCEGCRREASC